jgi:hypothetical protein
VEKKGCRPLFGPRGRNTIPKYSDLAKWREVTLPKKLSTDG